MKILRPAKLLLICCYLPSILLAEENHNLSLTTYLSTDYMFRGVSQTDNDVTLQLGLDYSHISGLQAGLFASNVDYNTPTRREQDVYVGYSKEFANGLGLDAYVWRYGYHNESEINYNEYTVSARYKWLNIKYWYSDDYSGTDGKLNYYEAEISVPVNDNFTFSIHTGHNDFSRSTGIDDYNDYSLSLSASYKGLDYQLLGTTTDGKQFGDLEDGRFVLMVSKTFSLIL